MVTFANRIDAGRILGRFLTHLQNEDVVVLGLPRGGIPVAFQVAQELGAPLDVIVVRKLGMPTQPEVAMGAIGEAGVIVLNSEVLQRAHIRQETLREVETRERAILNDRVESLRKGRARVDLKGRIAVIVDDGVATGSTARAACEVARQLGAARVILAVPVGPADAPRGLTRDNGFDEVICATSPTNFRSVGEHYVDFAPTSDDEVTALLYQASHRIERNMTTDAHGLDIDVAIPINGITLPGHLHLPDVASALVLFAHGSGSSRTSPRNQFVASALHHAGVGTLLFDLLTTEEASNRENLFDIPLLGSRLVKATRWLSERPDIPLSRIGYFGASTGAAAAMWAAAELGSDVHAIVSRGGRPDLAGPRLAQVKAPSLLIVGGHDREVFELNRRAQTHLRCSSRLVEVPGASHLFEEPGTLEQVSTLARDWFVDHLVPTFAGRR